MLKFRGRQVKCAENEIFSEFSLVSAIIIKKNCEN